MEVHPAFWEFNGGNVTACQANWALQAGGV
jgi:hypothetical protein